MSPSLPHLTRTARIILLIGCFIPISHIPFPGTAYAQQTAEKHTISGYVQDAGSGEKLIGATVYVPELQAGTATNTYGFYSLTLPTGPHRLVFSYIGYEPESVPVDLTQDLTRTVALAERSVLLDSVVVEDTRIEPIQERIRMGVIDVPVAQIEAAPALLGEVDVLKTLQLLPGVKTGAEASAGLYVRGGGPDQNLILLDGVPVYNASHLFGFLSVFNTDAVNNVQLTKGGFPAHYGGRLSSVVEINLKEGNMHEHVVQGAVGLLASRLTVEGPIVRDKTSFIVSGRRTYADLLAAPFIKDDDTKPVAYFYDLTAKVNHTFSPQDRVYFSIYSGQDRFGVDVQEDLANDDFSATAARVHWGNVTSALRWNHLFSNKLFSNTTFTYSRYRFGVDISETLFDPDGSSIVKGIDYRSGIRDWSGKIDFDYRPNPSQYIRFGAGAIYHTFTPSTLAFVAPGDADNPPNFAATDDRVGAFEVSAYVEDDLRLSNRLAVNAGLHASAFAVEGALYPSIQPRLSARYLLSDDLSAKAGFATMQQYVHLLTNSGVGLPTDLWVPTTDVLPPERSWQASAGLARSFAGGAYEASLEGYYKRMDNLLQYKDGASYAVAGANYENQVAVGEGWAYGVELFLQKRTGRTTGWLGYTLAWAGRQFDDINRGRPFPYRYDRRHDVNLTLTHRLSRRFDVSATWVYATGNAATFPVGGHAVITGPPEDPGTSGSWPVEFYGRYNAYRMPAYHRLDLGLNWYFARGERESYLSIGVYNAYNRKNPLYLEFLNNEQGQRIVRGTALLPIIPSISYNFRF